MPNKCTECGYPIRKPNRTMHVTCAAATAGEPDDQVFTGRECCFCHDRNTLIINGAPFCPEHRPGETPRVRSATTLTIMPERCPRCDEPLTPSVTKGNIKCKCDQPTAPRPCKPGCKAPHAHLTEAAWLARMGKVPMQSRYGN